MGQDRRAAFRGAPAGEVEQRREDDRDAPFGALFRTEETRLETARQFGDERLAEGPARERAKLLEPPVRLRQKRAGRAGLDLEEREVAALGDPEDRPPIGHVDEQVAWPREDPLQAEAEVDVRIGAAAPDEPQSQESGRRVLVGARLIVDARHAEARARWQVGVIEAHGLVYNGGRPTDNPGGSCKDRS